MTLSALDRAAQTAWQWWYDHIQTAPLWVRRGGAFLTEISLITGSAIVPYALGSYAQQRQIGQPVPLNAMLSTVNELSGQLLGTKQEANRNVSPLTNLFWTTALVTPLLVGSWQLYRLGTTGFTDPKRWFGVRIVSELGVPCGVGRIVLREAIGRWGIAGGLGFGFWLTIGAAPNGVILVGLIGVLALADHLLVRLDRDHRTLHDRLAGTHIMDLFQFQYGYNAYIWPSGQPNQDHWTRTDPDEVITAIIVADDEPPLLPPVPGLWLWMRSNPIITLSLVGLFCVAALLGTLAGTQIYVQQQTNQRQQTEEQNQLFINLVNKLTPQPGAPDERKNAILALGTLDDDRALALLIDLLSQETEPVLIDAIEQALVSRGAVSLPGLRRLNQGLRNELDALSQARNRSAQAQRTIGAKRLQATQQAIAKILTGYSGELTQADLSRTDLSRNETGDFALVLNRLDLAGNRFRGSGLRYADLQQSIFFSPGADRRSGNYDDVIADFSGADLSHANLSGANLQQVWLRRANLMRTTLSQANLSAIAAIGANFSSAQAIGSNFQAADLEQASFTGANLKTSDLTRARLREATFTRADVSGSVLVRADLQRSNWQEAEVSGADFRRADLRQANFSGANLSGANLNGADLRQVNFSGANLAGVDWRRSRLAGANFQGTRLLADPNQDQLVVAAATVADFFKGVDFSRVQGLDQTQLATLCQYGAVHPACR